MWGLHQDTLELWYLEEDSARKWRVFVNESVICPVPGCGAKLTTVHRSTKRDGLRHFDHGGKHSGESLFHSQGCALIEHWLRTTYPNSSVKREEYTNLEGERRADVLITSRSGFRVAFEVQYSSLTPAAWKIRHNSYRRQGIVDVWLFGHTSKQLTYNTDGTVRLKPVHHEVITSGSALMFINPDQQIIGVATSHDQVYDAGVGGQSNRTVEVWDKPSNASLSIHPLDRFRVTESHLTSDWLGHIYTQTQELREHNAAEQKRVIQLQREKALADQLELEALKRKRRPLQQQIRSQFQTVELWNSSQAQASIKAYFNGTMRRRIDENRYPDVPPGMLVWWQSVVYFDLIAGCSRHFGVRDAFATIKRRGINMGQPDAFKLIAQYLHQLADAGFLDRLYDSGPYPRFVPTELGAWR